MTKKQRSNICQFKKIWFQCLQNILQRQKLKQGKSRKNTRLFEVECYIIVIAFVTWEVRINECVAGILMGFYRT